MTGGAREKGLPQVEGILENYGIDSETDVSLLDGDDFPMLASRGLKPMEGKKLEHWFDTVCARAENILSWSLNTPTGAGLLSSEALNVLTLPAHSATMSESVSDNDSERDGEDVNNVSDSTHTASGGSGTMDILLDRSHTLRQKYRTCPSSPILWASFSVTHSILLPWNHIPMVHQIQLL